MTAEELDARLDRLSADAERAQAALVELELDPTRELLDASALVGRTSEEWRAASAAVAEAWQAHAALETHVARVRAQRAGHGRLSPARAAELAALLDAAAIACGGRDVPAPEVPARCEDAVAAMRRVLAGASQAWDALVPRLTTASATLRACDDVAAELGLAPDPRRDAARRELGRLTAAVAADPLAATPEPVEALEAGVARVRARVERLRDLRAGADERLDDARALLADAHRAEREGRDAHRAAVAKIADAELPDPVTVPPELAGELDRAAALAREGAWEAADAALERWTMQATHVRDDAQRAADACRAPLELRDELRGRLGAYRAKAQRLRLLEEPALAALHERAQRMLHSSPTDLRAASDLVLRYQQGVAGRAREARR
jgi:hypothetical protein